MFTLTGDIKFYYEYNPSRFGGADIKITGADLGRDPGLETAVLISLGTDARADDSDTLPEDGTRRGYWGEAVTGFNMGSKLWLLGRSKIDNNTLRLAEQYVSESLEWMVDEGMVKSVETFAAKNGQNQINFETRMQRPDNVSVRFKWYANWEYQITGGLAS